MQILRPHSTASGVWNSYLRGGYATWEVGQECEIHSHLDAAEVFVFLAGECEFTTDEGTVLVGAGATVYVDAGEKHKLKAVGDRPLEMFLAVMPNHEPTHTFYRADGTPVHWNRPAPGSAEASQRSSGPTRDDLDRR